MNVEDYFTNCNKFMSSQLVRSQNDKSNKAVILPIFSIEVVINSRSIFCIEVTFFNVLSWVGAHEKN